MELKDFKPGDLVTLKSGGPQMVVVGFIPPAEKKHLGMVLCKWIASDQKPQSDQYPAAALSKVE